MTELKPCPFCGVMPHIYWEAWKDISPDAGVWKLEANHKDSCYITHINGTNISGRSSARRLSQLVEWWNHREELCGNSEQLESGHEKDHVADPGKMVGDLISRQAAIKVIIAEGRNVDSRYLESERIIHESDAVEALSMLPSAPSEIIRCKDCKHWRQQTNYQGAPLSFGFCESDDMWQSLYGETYEVAHIDTDDDFYCGYAKRRTDELV